VLVIRAEVAVAAVLAVAVAVRVLSLLVLVQQEVRRMGLGVTGQRVRLTGVLGVRVEETALLLTAALAALRVVAVVVAVVLFTFFIKEKK